MLRTFLFLLLASPALGAPQGLVQGVTIVAIIIAIVAAGLLLCTCGSRRRAATKEPTEKRAPVSIIPFDERGGEL